jgi:(1->4)-alpha-D-glucan 1-alpha-D-glucosylmutase
MDEHVPRATYRLQFSAAFTFDDAARIVPYLKDLGISHIYASPFLKARKGSTHGYDIIDHNAFNPELGGEAAFLRFSDRLREAGMGLILDFVPNHMAIGRSDNPWWLDVLEWGQRSPYAAYFDIDWNALPHRRKPGVLLPILGKPYGDALRDGDLTLKYDPAAGSFAVWYFEHKLPISPRRYDDVLRQIVHAADAADKPEGRALLALADSTSSPTMPSYRDAPAFKQRIASAPGAAALIERGLVAYSADTPNGLALLHRLLERQHYRVAYWRIAFSAINYRRFFDINDLAGLRMEHAATFRAAHPLVARLIAEDRLQGLRLDHIDGLRDPMQYARRLHQLTRQVGRRSDFYVVAEKILEQDEAMPRFTGVAGTTGYEWLNLVTRLMVNGAGLGTLDATWREISGERQKFPEILDAAKSRVLDTMLASEFTVLTQSLSRIAAGHYSTRDYTLDRLRAALELYVRECPVYRTYVTAAGPSDRTPTSSTSCATASPSTSHKTRVTAPPASAPLRSSCSSSPDR